MVKEILTDLYKIDIPLPMNPLKTLNSYVIKAPERNLIIDTGWNQEECLNAMQAGLRELGVDIRKTDLFITHLHADHLGLAPFLASETSTIYFNQPDADRIRSGTLWDDLLNFTRLNGFPESKLKGAIDSHPGFKFGLKKEVPFHILRDGDRINIGDKEFWCVETPGHTRGHMCLYEPRTKIFLAGDHLLNDISPTIQSWSDDWDPLEEYLKSLDKVYQFDIELVLPGHRSIINHYKERIQELKSHHQKRLEEIISILGKGSQDAYQIASQMTWDIMYDSWELFPISQKWFGMGEAIAHLKYLVQKGTIQKKIENKKIMFSFNSSH